MGIGTNMYKHPKMASVEIYMAIGTNKNKYPQITP
jgi:hypothetical protein